MSNKNDNVNKNLRRIKGVGGKILRIGKRKRTNRKVEPHALPNALSDIDCLSSPMTQPALTSAL